MEALFEGLALTDWHDDLLRNIKTLRVSEDLFDDLSPDPADRAVARAAEAAAKPAFYTDLPALRRPFERAAYIAAVRFPFDHWAQSRYSDGRFGVWYGADRLETTVHETLYHWLRFLHASGFDRHPQVIVGERRVYRVRCEAALLDLRTRVATFPALLDPQDYGFTQEVGRRVHREGHPGLVTRSARCAGDVFAVFRVQVLSQPRGWCHLTYTYDAAAGRVGVEREPGEDWLRLEVYEKGSEPFLGFIGLV